MAEDFNEEQPTFKVADRRKFNLDGSLRDGVTIEETAARIETVAAEQTAPEPVAQQETATSIHLEESEAELSSQPEDLPAGEMSEEEFDEAQLPGAENPASFANFLLSLASQAAAALGLSENPMSGQRRADLEMSKYWLDVLGMLHEKTKGNLHPQEQRLFDGLLGDLRMQFVQLRRVAEAQMRRQEEQLMKQAAQKFSGKDILGK